MSYLCEENTMIQEICALCDRSGSMLGKEKITIDGLNDTINELKNNQENTKINYTLKLFNDTTKILYDRVDINDVSEISRQDFITKGKTALLDCLGFTLQLYIDLKSDIKNTFNIAMIYVLTDGLENSSKFYTYDKVKELVGIAESLNINVIYIGSNQDSIHEASKYGISKEKSMDYSETKKNTIAVSRAVSHMAKRMRKETNVEFLQSERVTSVDKDNLVIDNTNNTNNTSNTILTEEQRMLLDNIKNNRYQMVQNMININPGLISWLCNYTQNYSL